MKLLFIIQSSTYNKIYEVECDLNNYILSDDPLSAAIKDILREYGQDSRNIRYTPTKKMKKDKPELTPEQLEKVKQANIAMAKELAKLVSKLDLKDIE